MTTQWMIRITAVEKDKLVSMLERFSNDALIVMCAEGEPYDKGVQPHVHIYTENKHSESWIRKQIQNLDVTRKSNQLYSMKKAHEHSVNYVLKNYFIENNNRDRLWFQRNAEFFKFVEWRQMHEAYMAEVNRKKKVRSKSKKSFSRELIEEIAAKWSASSPSNHELMIDVINYYKSQETLLPTRNQMESLILNIRSALGQETYVVNFYRNIFSDY